jgi:hypothetical protein
MTNFPMTQIAPIIDHAAAQNDRWLFLLALALLGLFAFVVIRWLVNRTEKQNDVIAVILKEQNATAKELAVLIARCVEALDENSHQIQLSRDHPTNANGKRV